MKIKNRKKNKIKMLASKFHYKLSPNNWKVKF